ncbi:MAG TPA: branched-chain amino acid ABC transporter ATP-binding protein/permease [Acetobacteraceae bacterium]|jgi:ABC-type branched-subunit amino acid transport system ATPase component/ABC-type branched-subunit amino acid transport system permease subunit|nr:branched-chain amino acid ABC transporter ATP-binding protein/permease [Acetobacteraceae bacterium]
MTPLLRHPIPWIVLVLIALTGLWHAIGAPISLITQIAIYMLYGAGVNLLVGYTGLVPFGASVFFGCATYAVAISMRRFLGNEIEALIFAVLFSLVLAAAIALIILRRRGLYFSLLTLAFSQIAFEVAFKWTDMTGGENGLQGVPRPLFESDWAFHSFAVVTVALGMGVLWRIAHSPFGRLLQALRDNEQRVRTLGYNTFRIKFEAFVIMGGVVGYAGALLSFMLHGAYADNLSWQHAGDSLLMTVMGGVHHFLGPLWGAIAFILLEDRLSAITESWWLIFAPVVMIFALASPEGMQGLVFRLIGREDWTLVRRGIPPRPARIVPYRGGADTQIDTGRPLLQVRSLHKRFGSLVVAADVYLEVHPCRLHSLIGPNGAGKTTFFNMLTGLLRADAGEIRFDDHTITNLAVHRRIRLGLSRSFQILSVFRNLTTFENARVAVQMQSPHRHNLWRDAYRLDDVNARTWSLLAAVGLEDRAAEPCANLSHGEQRLLEIAIALATDAKLLLLDEPLAGLAEADREVVGALIRQLAATHAVLLIEHDIDRVLALSDRITVLHQGRVIADGKPAEVANNPDVITAYMGTARAGGPQPTVHAESVQPIAAKSILQLQKVRAGYAGSLVLTDLDLTVHEGEAVALLGRNGVGKTTMLRAISGTVQKSAGQITMDGKDITHARPFEINRLGISIVPEGRRLFPNLTVTENLQIAARPGGASFDEIYELFPKLKILQRARAESLSGGERQMLAIARALTVPSRLILLDEPFEGLAPAVVQEVMDALVRLRGRVAMIIVEHHAETVLPIADRAYVLVNGQVAYEGSAKALEADAALQARLLGIVQQELTAA